MELEIQKLRNLCKDETIQMTSHVIDRCKQRDITYIDIKHCVMTGQIIERYPDDYPYPSCLLLGVSVNNKYLHIVVSVNAGLLWIITAYYPDTDKWESDLKTRKGR